MIDPASMLHLGVFLVRPGLLVVSAPAFGGQWAPPTIKIGLTVVLAIASLAAVAPPVAAEGPGLVVVIAREALIGIALGFGVRVVVAAAEFAGQLAGFQLGFLYASVVDPQAGVRNNVLSSVYGLLTLMVFLGLNAHHDLLRALVMSYEAVPVGLGGIDGSLAALSARLLGLVFTTAVHLAAPILVVMLIVELALGLAARAAPMLNLMAQGFPVRLLVGLIALAAMLRIVRPVVERAIPVALALVTDLAAALR